MALVMLPSDLPWWYSVQTQLKKISITKTTLELVECMQNIYEMCNISLDPDDDNVDPQHFVSFLNFLDNELSAEERSNFFKKILPNLVKSALMIKELRPKRGLHFSLQQQADVTELPYTFISSLLANAFFSTFPKRTEKSHPTLQNFNFATFFKDLSTNAQKSKLRSFLYYFEWLENNDNVDGCLRIFRQIMSSKEWLTIDDWLECCLPLCPVQIRHDGKLERSESENLQVCFSSAKIGGNVLETGCSQESILFSTAPELLAILLSVEALEDNEVITIENVRNISRISDPKHRANLEKLTNARELTVCCMDADDYTKLPIGQYEEDNVLRELNKCLLAFEQKHTSKIENNDSIGNHLINDKSIENQKLSNSTTASYNHRQRRLSPIGESFHSVHSDRNRPEVPLITQNTCSSRQDSVISLIENNNDSHKLGVQLEMEKNLQKRGQISNDTLVHNRRGRFIVLGSSGECLPVTRSPIKKRDSIKSNSSSCESEEFLSAKSSFEGSEEEKDYHKRYSIDLQDPDSRQFFAHRLKHAMREHSAESADLEDGDLSSSEEESYAIGISVTGSGVGDCDIKVRRQGSTGFALGEDSLDEEMFQNSLNHERQWVDKFKNKQPALCKRDSSNRSSECSFSTEYSSELEEVYEQFSQWLENPILETDKGTKRKLDSRDLAVVRFAGSLLKRTLSESFAGIPVPMAEPCDTVSEKHSNSSSRKNKLVLSAKSLSLELARQKHRLAAQLSVDSTYPSTDPFNHQQALDESKLTPTNRAWYITCMQGAIIQTLEDIVVKISAKPEVSQIAQKSDNGLRPISSGNWGCGSSRKGDAQLKVVVQWMAASVAGAPFLVYYTNQHQHLAKLDTVCRILIDRKWTVKALAEATLRYSNHVLRGRQLSGTLFEELIGVDKNDNL